MNIACVMMQKNETALLGPWVEYHAALCGIENLYVLDNGSNHPKTLELLRVFEQRGLNVNYEHIGRSAYAHRESIVTEVFRALGESARYDFIFPLDCDEFLACHRQDGEVSAEPTDIEAALEPFRNDPRTLTIAGAYDNVPMGEDLFIPSPTQRKCFFASGQCQRLGLGYHVCQALHSDDSAQTPIVYFHIHNRPYRHYKYAAFEKLAGRVPDFTGQTLTAHSAERREGFHLISGFAMREEAYARRFNLKRALRMPQLKQRLSALGCPLVFRDSDVPDVQKALQTVRGYAETARLLDGYLCVNGWSLVEPGLPAQDFKVVLRSTELCSPEIRRRKRPDVQRAHPDAPEESGFELRIPQASLPSGTASTGPVSVHVLHPETGIYVPLICRSVLG